MARLSASMIAQIETAIDLVIGESGHGEIVLPVAKGQLLNYVERRPVIRMVVYAQASGPPGQHMIERRCATG